MDMRGKASLEPVGVLWSYLAPDPCANVLAIRLIVNSLTIHCNVTLTFSMKRVLTQQITIPIGSLINVFFKLILYFLTARFSRWRLSVKENTSYVSTRSMAPPTLTASSLLAPSSPFTSNYTFSLDCFQAI